MRADSLPAEPQGKPKNTGVGNLFLLQGIFPYPGIKPGSPALQADSLPTELSGKPKTIYIYIFFFKIKGKSPIIPPLITFWYIYSVVPSYDFSNSYNQSCILGYFTSHKSFPMLLHSHQMSSNIVIVCTILQH